MTHINRSKNREETIKSYAVLAKDGNQFAQYSLGHCYRTGFGVIKNDILAIELITKAAQQGNIPAQCALGAYYEQKKEDIAISWYTKAAEQGDTIAQNKLVQFGVFYLKNLSTIEKAKDLFEKAAKQGNVEGQFRLGGYYYNYQNFAEAIKWFEMAAKQNHIQAINDLGICYIYDSPSYNAEKAFEWFKKAADVGDATGQYNLAICYRDGRGIAKDIDKALKLFQLASPQDDFYAEMEFQNFR